MLIGTLQFARMEGLSESHSSPLDVGIDDQSLKLNETYSFSWKKAPDI